MITELKMVGSMFLHPAFWGGVLAVVLFVLIMTRGTGLLCYLFGHKIKRIPFLSQDDGLFCSRCKTYIEECERCGVSKCRCQVVYP